MKLKVQAQHLQPGDVVGSGEVVERVRAAGIDLPSNKIVVTLNSSKGIRVSQWGKYTEINVERPEKEPRTAAGSLD